MVKGEPKIVGIIGGVSSGKSTISKLFAKLGAEVIDADDIAHKVLAFNRVKAEIGKLWGNGIVSKNKRLNRKMIAEKVFNSKKEIKKLNDIVHPLIRKEIEKRVANVRKKDIIIIDAALLCESGYIRKCDKVVFVKTPLNIRRIRSRNKGWNGKEVEKRERFQLPINKKAIFADYIIDNSKTVNYAFKQVKEIYNKVLN